MRIGMAGFSGLGGSGIAATELALKLAERGHEVHLFALGTPLRFRPHPRLTLHLLDPPQHPLFPDPPYLSTLAGALARGEWDLIHVHFAFPHSLAAFLAGLLSRRRVPVVHTLHGSDVTVFLDHPYLGPLIRLALSRGAAVTAVSRFLAREARFRGLPRPRVIPNLVDPDRFHPSRRSPRVRREVAPRGEFILAHASNFRQVKRCLDLLRVFGRVRSRLPVRLLLLGDGPEREGFLERAREAGWAEDLHWVGITADPEHYLAQADVLLLTSELESFSLVAAEALASGVPVVGYRVGGLPEVVPHGKAGFLVPPGDTEAAARAVLRLLKADALRLRLSRGAIEAASRFFPEKVLPLWEELYSRLLGRRPRSRSRRRQPGQDLFSVGGTQLA